MEAGIGDNRPVDAVGNDPDEVVDAIRGSTPGRRTWSDIPIAPRGRAHLIRRRTARFHYLEGHSPTYDKHPRAWMIH